MVLARLEPMHTSARLKAMRRMYGRFLGRWALDYMVFLAEWESSADRSDAQPTCTTKPKRAA